MRTYLIKSVDRPAWVEQLFDVESACCGDDRRGIWVSVWQSDDLSLLRTSASGVLNLSAEALRSKVSQLYLALADQLGQCRASHPVRVWNYVAGINDLIDPQLDRYMVFSSGRHDACRQRYGGDFARRLPAASAVGAPNDELVIEVLAAERPGRPVENRRQIPGYRYSQRYGPLPPCFARATVIDDASVFGSPCVALLSGTASIVGEATCHVNDLDAQLNETFENLSSLVRDSCAAASLQEPDSQPPSDMLVRIRNLRAYVVRRSDFDCVTRAIEKNLPHLRSIELVHTSLCRPDLLVEIEGVADLVQSAANDRPPVTSLAVKHLR